MPRLSYFRERLSPLRSAYDRNQRGKGNAGLRKTDEGCGTSLRALGAILFSVDFGHIRTAVETEVRREHISKAQSGQRLDHGYTVDGRSG